MCYITVLTNIIDEYDEFRHNWCKERELRIALKILKDDTLNIALSYNTHIYFLKTCASMGNSDMYSFEE